MLTQMLGHHPWSRTDPERHRSPVGYMFRHRRGDLHLGCAVQYFAVTKAHVAAARPGMSAGLETPDNGSIGIDGRDVTALAPSERGLSIVFQSYALFPHLSVKDIIEFGMRVRRVQAGERRARLNEALDLTDLQGFEARKPAQL